MKQEQQQFITDVYHFMCEMIIVSILLLLPIHYYYHWVPAWSMLVVIALLCILFVVLEKQDLNHSYYYFTLLLLIPTFLYFRYPLLLSVFISCIVLWRYFRIRHVLVIGREAAYLLLTPTLSIVVFLITNNLYSIMGLFLQLLVIIIGFMCSNISVLERSERTLLYYKGVIYLLLLMSCGGMIAYWISSQTYLVKIWDSTIYFLFSLIGRVLFLVPFMENNNNEDEIDIGTGIESLENVSTELPIVSFILGGYMGIGVILAIFGLIMIILIFKGDKSSKAGIKGITIASGKHRGDVHFPEEQKGLLTWWKISKKHPVRILVHKFERKAIKHQLGRKTTETIDEWLKRIGLNVDVHVYQKVRYGEMEVSKQEVEVLRREIERFKELLKK